MKTNPTSHPFAKRILHGVIAILCISATPAAFAGGKASIALAGQELGNNKSISVDSGNRRVDASERYTYNFTGRVRGKRGTPAAKIIPSGTDISAFVDSISPGASTFLNGSFPNSSGNLNHPVTVLDKKVSGKRNVKGLGVVTVSLTLLGRIETDGTCVLEIKNVKFKSSLKKKLGSIEFMKGSKLIISAAPVFTFLKKQTNVAENAGQVTLSVKRLSNVHGKGHVTYTTTPGTADGTDYTHVVGTVEFEDLEFSKDITIDITNNEEQDGPRTFTVVLSDPSSGGVVGSMPSTLVKIIDDD